jgi:hypothetical protein
MIIENHPQTGVVRLDARDKFMKLLKKALMMCMSKHDQVIIHVIMCVYSKGII